MSIAKKNCDAPKINFDDVKKYNYWSTRYSKVDPLLMPVILQQQWLIWLQIFSMYNVNGKNVNLIRIEMWNENHRDFFALHTCVDNEQECSFSAIYHHNCKLQIAFWLLTNHKKLIL